MLVGSNALQVSPQVSSGATSGGVKGNVPFYVRSPPDLCYLGLSVIRDRPGEKA
jgi:hypothetical protein